MFIGALLYIYPQSPKNATPLARSPLQGYPLAADEMITVVIKARHLALLAAVAIVWRSAYSFADNLTVTTYYPSPYGVYDRLRTRSDTFLAVSAGGQVGIGTASPDPGVKVHVVGAVQIADGTQALGRVLTSDAFGRASWQAPMTPPGAIMFFNAPVCPAGWSELASARGRYIVGLPNAGTLGATMGLALSDLENRPVGRHTHTITSIAGGKGSNGGTSANSAVGDPAGNITTNAAGAVAGTNAPYIQLLVCQKN